MIPISSATGAAAAARRLATSGNVIENSEIREVMTMLEADKVFIMSIPYILVKTTDKPGKEIMGVKQVKEIEQRDIGTFRKKMADVPVTKEVKIPINEMIREELPAGAAVHGITIDWYHHEVDVVYTINA